MASNTSVTLDHGIKQDSPAAVTGSATYDGTEITTTDVTEVTLGFTPKHIKWVNLTDRVVGEWFVGMGDNACLKTAADGTATNEAVGITVTSKGFTVSQNATLGLIAASKNCYFHAEG